MSDKNRCLPAVEKFRRQAHHVQSNNLLNCSHAYTIWKSPAFPNPGVHPGLEKPGVYLLRSYTSKTDHLIYLNTSLSDVPMHDTTDWSLCVFGILEILRSCHCRVETIQCHLWPCVVGTMKIPHLHYHLKSVPGFCRVYIAPLSSVGFEKPRVDFMVYTQKSREDWQY
jgi:hypothetical protein